jgi:multidrug efflux pump subunit AcrA (membrane-fusion protein)
MEISTGRSAGALRVPSRALAWRTLASGGVLSTRSTPYVWIAEPTGVGEEYSVRPVDVTVGRSDGTLTEILSGLKEGERVVSAGHHELKDGDRVREEHGHE